MNVVCINSNIICMPLKRIPIEGEVYNVIDDNGCGEGCCYRLEGFDQNLSKTRFVPVSDIDETTLVNAEPETANV